MTTMMATRIEDLPVQPIPEREYKNEYTSHHDREINNTNITKNKKNVTFAEPLEEHFEVEENSIISEFSEENILVLFFLYLATLPFVTELVMRIPYVSEYSMFSNIAKAIVLLGGYILCKVYILPKLSI